MSILWIKQRRSQRFSKLFVIVSVLLLGFFFRALDIAAEPFQGDEVETSFLAFSFGHYGIRPELGVITSNQSNQSPFFHDVFAPVFAFDPDIRIARLSMALLHVVSMAGLFFIVRRYWSFRTAVTALLLYALMPRATWSGRFLWNPSLVLPFVIGLYATGMLATEGKRWARWLQPVMWCGAFQSHPAALMTVVLVPFFFAVDLRNSIKRRRVGFARQIALDYAVGALLAGLMLAPWAVGVLHARAETPPDVALVELKKPSSLERIFTLMIDNPIQLVNHPAPDPVYIPSPPELVAFYRAIGALALLGSVGLLGIGIVKGRVPDAMLGIAVLSFPVLLSILPTRTYDHYVIALLPATAIIWAVIFVGGQYRVPWLRLGVVAVGLVCTIQAGYFLYWLWQLHTLTTFAVRALPPLTQELWLRDEAEKSGYETVYLVEGDTWFYREHTRLWLMLTAKNPRARVLSGANLTLPVPDSGVTYVGYTDAPHIPELFDERAARVELGTYFRVVDVPPRSAFTPTCVPEGPTRLSNGATILGYYAPQQDLPTPGKLWTIYMLWKGVNGDPPESYQMFNHLVDDTNIRHGQNDVPILHTSLWRKSDTYVTKIMLQPDAATRADMPLHLRVGMYTLEDFKNTSVTDSDGNPVAQWVTIPICAVM